MDNTINTIFWLLPIGLICLLIYRAFQKVTNKTSGANTKVIKSRKTLKILKYVMFCILIGLVLLFCLNLGRFPIVNLYNYTPHVSADEFLAMMSWDENDVAGMFHEKKFEREKEVDSWGGQTRFFYTYRLENPHWDRYDSKSLQYLDEISISSTHPDFITYKIKELKQYENYFRYLSEIKIRELSKDEYKICSVYVEKNEKAYMYKDKVFVKKGYISNDNAYVIYIFPKDYTTR